MSFSLSSLGGSAFDAGAGILDTLYGGTSGSSGSTGQSPIAALLSAEQNQTQDVAVTAAQPTVKSAIAAFTQGVQSAKSVTQLLSNPAVMNVLLTANGMSDQIGYTALATKALTSNLSDPNSLVNQLSDTRWQTLAQTYNFNTNGLSAIQKPAAIAAVANAYATAQWQTSQDTVTPGLSNALAFKAQASSIKSAEQILGSTTMFTVVTTALGIPEQIVYQPLSAQEQAINNRLDVTKLQDPKFVQNLVEQYLIANNANTASSTSSGYSDLTTLATQAQGLYA